MPLAAWIDAAFAATTVALPAGTDPSGWADAAASTGVVIVSAGGDVRMTATPSAWILEVVPAGPTVRVGPPRTLAEREALLVLASSLTEPLGSAREGDRSGTPVAPAPAPSGTGDPTGVARARATPERVPSPGGGGRPRASDAAVTGPSSGETRVEPGPVAEPGPGERAVAGPSTDAAPSVGAPIPSVASASPSPETGPAVVGRSPAEPPAPGGDPAEVAPAPAASRAEGAHPPTFSPTAAAGAAARLDGGVAGALRLGLAATVHPGLRVEARAGWTSASNLPVAVEGASAQTFTGTLGLEVGDTWFVHGGGGVSAVSFHEDGEDRGSVVWPLLEAGFGRAFVVGPLVLAPELGLRADLSTTSLSVRGEVQGVMSPVWGTLVIGSRLAPR